MLQCCVRRRRLSSVTLCIVAKRCVLEQKLQLEQVVYEISIGTKMNDFDLCLDVVIKVTGTIALHLTLNISETVRDREGPPIGNSIWATEWSRGR